jgi:hypothetical protein
MKFSSIILRIVDNFDKYKASLNITHHHLPPDNILLCQELTDTDPTGDVATSTTVNSGRFFVFLHEDEEEPTVGTYVTVQAVVHPLLRQLITSSFGWVRHQVEHP